MRRGRLWRALYWVAVLAIIAEALGLTATFRELQRRRREDAAALAPDQIASLVRLWPSLTSAQKPEVLRALSWSGLSYRELSEPPAPEPGEVRVPLIEAGLRKRLGSGEDVSAWIRGSRPGRPGLWALSTAPVHIFVRVGPADWLEAEARGELGARFLGQPTGFWVGVLGLLLAAGVLLVILREGAILARISRALEVFAATGEPQPTDFRGSPELKALARRSAAMQEQVAALLRERIVMLGAIAHDIKTYVQRLKLRLELMDEPGQVEKAEHDLDAMNRFVEDALLLAVHAQPLQDGRPFDLSAVVAQEAEAARLAGGDATLACEGEGPWQVKGDADAMSRAVGNIVGNAIRYGASARIALQRRGGRLELTVDDRGPGVPKAEREAVFSPFRRGEQSRNRATGGSGLGLAIARSIVEQHAGAIEIGNAPQGGARVTISLPAANS